MIKILSEPKPIDVLVYIYNNRYALLDDDVELAIELLEKRRQQIQQVRLSKQIEPKFIINPLLILGIINVTIFLSVFVLSNNLGGSFIIAILLGMFLFGIAAMAGWF